MVTILIITKRSNDHIARVNFAEGFLAQVTALIRRFRLSFPLLQGPVIHFSDYILWTDEANFIPNGMFNSKNYVFWTDRNPRLVR